MDPAVAAIGERDAHASFVVGDFGDLGIETQFGAWVPLEVGTQQGLEFGLVEHVGLRETMHAARRVAVELASTLNRLSSSRNPSVGREIAANSSAMPRRATTR